MSYCQKNDSHEDQALAEVFLSREEIFRGAVMHVTRDTVRLPNGKNATREVAWHRGAVAILPVFDDGTVVLERQYRYAHGRVVLEIPAGKLEESDQAPMDAARRELAEETGLSADRWSDLGAIVPSVAILSERIMLYLAEGLHEGDRSLDEDEFLNVVRLPLDEAVGMVLSGEIEDSKTQVALLKYAALRASRAQNA